jgi:hypothetical protein
MFKRTATAGLIPALIVSTIAALALFIPASAAKVTVLTVSDCVTYSTGIPAISSMNPHAGPTAGGTTVTINGSHFLGTTAVMFGNLSASSFNIVSDIKITAVSPASGRAMTVNVHVTNPCGTSATVSQDRFTFTGARCTSAQHDYDNSQGTLEGSPVYIFAWSTGCPDPEYRYFVRKPGSYTWFAVTGWIGNSFTWDTTRAMQGVWGVAVDVREKGHTVAYEAFSFGTMKILTACTSASLFVNQDSPMTPGPDVLLQGFARNCNHKYFRFYIKSPGGSWTLVRGWSVSNTYTWHTAGKRLGQYMLEVQARDLHSASRSWDSYQALTFWLGT